MASSRTILCYGDSNTHGQMPASYERYPLAQRWTAILQTLLGEGHRVIDEGLGGRTVNLDVPDRAGYNGYAYFLPCLSSHQPLDRVIIMLGTNDLKVRFDRPVKAIVQGLAQYLEAVGRYDARVLLVSPVVLNPRAPQWDFFGEGSFDETSAAKSRQLVPELEKLAVTHGCDFLAASSIVEPGVDGLHLDAAAHRLLAEALASCLAEDSRLE